MTTFDETTIKRIRRAAAKSKLKSRRNSKYYVVVCHYDGTDRVWLHSTLKAAFRKLGSAISGKLNKRGGFIAAIVMPSGECIPWEEARNIIDLSRGEL